LHGKIGRTRRTGVITDVVEVPLQFCAGLRVDASPLAFSRF
jgi:hypothetical protein